MERTSKRTQRMPHRRLHRNKSSNNERISLYTKPRIGRNLCINRKGTMIHPWARRVDSHTTLFFLSSRTIFHYYYFMLFPLDSGEQQLSLSPGTKQLHRGGGPPCDMRWMVSKECVCAHVYPAWPGCFYSRIGPPSTPLREPTMR